MIVSTFVLWICAYHLDFFDYASASVSSPSASASSPTSGTSSPSFTSLRDIIEENKRNQTMLKKQKNEKIIRNAMPRVRKVPPKLNTPNRSPEISKDIVYYSSDSEVESTSAHFDEKLNFFALQSLPRIESTSQPGTKEINTSVENSEDTEELGKSEKRRNYEKSKQRLRGKKAVAVTAELDENGDAIKTITTTPRSAKNMGTDLVYFETVHTDISKRPTPFHIERANFSAEPEDSRQNEDAYIGEFRSGLCQMANEKMAAVQKFFDDRKVVEEMYKKYKYSFVNRIKSKLPIFRVLSSEHSCRIIRDLWPTICRKIFTHVYYNKDRANETIKFDERSQAKISCVTKNLVFLDEASSTSNSQTEQEVLRCPYIRRANNDIICRSSTYVSAGLDKKAFFIYSKVKENNIELKAYLQY